LDIRKEIRDFISDNFLIGKNPSALADSGSLLELGIIDSTGVLELVGFLEEKFGMTVADEDLVPSNLDSVDNLVRFVESRTTGSQRQAS
jgi:acyl carrier protein